MLEVRELTKRYHRVPAVDRISFTLQPGSVSGYLGPNGSGKSTTVKMITGLLEPSEGHVLFDGRDIQHHLIEFRKRLGYVPEEPYLYPYMSGREYLQLVGRLRSIPQPVVDRKVDDLLALFGLERHRHAAISSYSKGMKQKILITAALLHNPDLLIFDEPLSGLDVTSMLVFRSVVQALGRAGKMILYSSHVLEVVEKVCSSVIILHRGRIMANDRVERLRDLMKLPSLEDIFRQLVLQEDTERIARDIVEAIQLHA
ncbi:MAG TPA: ABC transporter ATP-binding protein [Terriglobia bacterium]|nr:ABC transporter ATP-binding protein [Terriglobia bacterium]